MLVQRLTPWLLLAPWGCLRLRIASANVWSASSMCRHSARQRAKPSMNRAPAAAPDRRKSQQPCSAGRAPTLRSLRKQAAQLVISRGCASCGPWGGENAASHAGTVQHDGSRQRAGSVKRKGRAMIMTRCEGRDGWALDNAPLSGTTAPPREHGAQKQA